MSARTMDYEDFIQAIKKNNLIIYGAGHVANKLFAALCNFGCDKNIKGVLTTEGNNRIFHKYKIMSIDDYNYQKGDLVCIAVHEVLLEEIEKRLKSKSIETYIWVYPFLYRFMLEGTLLEQNITVDMKFIIERTIRDYYLLAVRRVALGQFLHQNDYGYDLYIKCVALHCGKSTAQKRLVRFIDLASNWDVSQVMSYDPLDVFEDGLLFDGTHRLVLLNYHNLKEVKCNVYKKTCQLPFTDEGHLTKRVLLREGFHEDDIKKLDEANRAMTI